MSSETRLVNVTWNLEDNLLTGQLVVQLGEGVELVVNGRGVLGVQQDLLDLRATNQVSDSLTGDLGREHQVLQDLVVHSGQGSGSWSLLELSGLSSWLWQDSSLSQEHNVSVWELLLELSSQSGLNLSVADQGRNWHEDGKSLLTARDLKLSDGLELQWSQVSLKVCLGFQVNEGLGDLQLQFVWVLGQDLVGSRHLEWGGFAV